MEAKDTTQLPPSMETAAAAIADRCAKDPAWMEKFKANPRQTLQEACGRELPDEVQIHLHQNDNDNWHVPVPNLGGKISDGELRVLAGGEVAIVLAYTLIGVGVASGIGVGVAAGGSIAAGVLVTDKKKRKGKK